MKTITISKSSWHFRLMKMLGLEARYSESICGYLRGLFLITPIFGAILLAFVGVGIVSLIGTGQFLGWVTAMVVMLTWLYPVWFEPLGFIVVGIAIIMGIRPIASKVPEHLPQMPEWVGAAWESVHDRICRKVKLT